MKNKSVLIIDRVGKIAGMDYYDSRLAEGLNACGIPAYVASNYKKEAFTYQCFHSLTQKTKAGKITDLFTGLLKALLLGRQKKAHYVLTHIFSTEIKDFFVVGMAKLFGFKVIVIAHDVSGFANTDSRRIKDLIFNHFANMIVVHNEFSARALNAVLKPAAQKHVHIIPHGSYVPLAQSSVLTRQQAREMVGIAPSQKVILFFGQIKKVKGLDILLKSMADIEGSVLLLMAGRLWRDDFSAYENLIKKHGLEHRIKLFIRYITDEERETFFRAADLLVIPYRAIFQSGVLLMGMSYKVPILASDLLPNRNLVTHGQTGLLFKTEDSSDLARQVNHFFSGDYNAEAIKRNAFEFLQKNHCWHTIAAAYKTIL